MATKKQKKPIDLNMGGILPRRLQPIAAIKTQTSSKAQLKPKATDSKQKIRSKRGKKTIRSLNLASTAAFAKNKVLYLLVPLWVLGLYLFAIHDFPPSGAGDNIQTSDFQHLSQISDVSFLPVKLFLVVLAKAGITSQLSLRLISAAIVAVSLLCFYRIIASWINKRAAVLSVLLFSSTGWMLFQARQDTVSTMLFALVPLFLYLGVLAAETESLILRILCGIGLAQLIFVPGGIWFMLLAIIIGAIYDGKDIDIPSLTPAVVSFLAALILYGAVILSFMSIAYKTELLRLAGFFTGHVPALSVIKENLVQLPNQLFYSGLNDGSLWLRGTPIIDYVSLIFLVAGLAYLIKNREAYTISRVVIIVFLVLSLIFTAVNGPLFISVMMPVVYMAVAAGLAYVLDQWLVIFPSNPLPRLFGIAVICISVFLVMGYQVERYFIGWPRTDEYHQIYKS